MIQAHLEQQASEIHDQFSDDVTSLERWTSVRDRYKREYLYMMGLWPMPEKTPLQGTVTGMLEGDGFVVDMLHYQSRPGLYVTANLYRPAKVNRGERLPAVLYLCGHSSRSRNGHKSAFQSHPIWFARRGYVCLIVDALQRGEIAAIHHGTYREGRWWWHARGYTPAGVEYWNGVRGIDYLIGRPDVDPERIAMTGISGGAATFWITAADERMKAAVPVSGIADLPSYVSNRVTNGHRDCMFLHNTFHWPWTRIAALVAPRPMLFVNSDHDRIFPMDANERVINRLERFYSRYGKGDLVDSERDLVTGPRDAWLHPIESEKLRVFPSDADIPKDELPPLLDEHFVPMVSVAQPSVGQFAQWKRKLLAELRRVSFNYFPKRVPPANLTEMVKTASVVRIETEPGIHFRLERAVDSTGQPRRVLLLVGDEGADARDAQWVVRSRQAGNVLFQLQTRGVGDSRWTGTDPPNYIKRSHVLLGRTVDSGRVWDVVAVARYLRSEFKNKLPVYVMGRRGRAVFAAYAALVEQDIAGVIASRPPMSHMEPGSPQLLNVL